VTAVGVAALDANVLVPIVACDFLLTAFDHALYDPVASAAVLDEVERTLLEDFPHIDPEGLRRRVGYMRTALVDHTIETTGADVPDSVNPKDRHIVGAALAGAVPPPGKPGDPCPRRAGASARDARYRGTGTCAER